ncbi:MAG: hypothetical protein R3247_16600 [Rhodothermales bacterium]|nr:hypothetical protein [Rhodothermales bacterium]
MLRVLFSVLAVVVALLAFVLEQPVLYAAAAVLLLIVIILWSTVARRRHREARRPYLRSTPNADDDLKALGIMEIRPRSEASAEAAATPAATPAATETTAPAAAEPAEAAPVPRPRYGTPARTAAAPVDASTATAVAEAPPAVMAPPEDDDALAPLLASVRAAVGAETVCLLRQPDLEPDYEVVASAGGSDVLPGGRTFSSPVPLLTAHTTRHPVTVHPVGDDGIPPDALGYRAHPGTVRTVALAPLERPDAPDVLFLVADAGGDTLEQARAQALLAEFARLAGTLLDPGGRAAALPPEPQTHAPRPRREIIADEMDAARAEERPLALALVYLNRAEALADEGEARVATAERLFDTRLRQAAPDSRVVRFGELTYGLFYDGAGPDVEAWGERLQREFERETGMLEGGISVGIAQMQDRHHSPDALRSDATDALREAYTSGACTILE